MEKSQICNGQNFVVHHSDVTDIELLKVEYTGHNAGHTYQFANFLIPSIQANTKLIKTALWLEGVL